MTIFLTSSPCIPGIDKTVLNPQNGFLERLKAALPPKPKVLTICSDPNRHDLTVYYGELYEAASREAGIPFGAHRFMDGTNEAQAKELIGWADFIILSGGHVPTQNRFFHKIQLKDLLKGYYGVLMGISAGSMNSAEVVYAHPEEQGEAVDPGYQRFLPGLGLTTLQILPHYQMIKDDVLDELRIFEDIAYPDSFGNSFLVLPDGSYVYIRNSETTVFGEAYELADGIMKQTGENRF